MVDTARLPPLASIRAFEAAARLGSFASAGRQLNMSAAAVSYHVRQLERYLDVSLFIRSAQSVRLTDAGSIIAEEVTSAFSALRASFSRAAQLKETQLSITALPTLGTTWLAPRLGHFRQEHPYISVSLELSAEAEALGPDGFDAAIRNGHGRWPGLDAHFLFPSLFMPLCRPELKAATKDIADPTADLEVPLLGRPDWWSLWFQALGAGVTFDPSRFGSIFSAEHLDIAAALAGHGVAIGSPILFRSEIEAGRLVPAHNLVATDGRAFWLVSPKTRRTSRKLELFRDWLIAQASAARESVGAELAMKIASPATHRI